MEASQEGHLELVRYMLEAGASVAAITGKYQNKGAISVYRVFQNHFGFGKRLLTSRFLPQIRSYLESRLLTPEMLLGVVSCNLNYISI